MELEDYGTSLTFFFIRVETMLCNIKAFSRTFSQCSLLDLSHPIERKPQNAMYILPRGQLLLKLAFANPKPLETSQLRSQTS